MIDKNFFNKKQEFITLKDVLEITGSKLVDGNNYDLSKKIYNVATLENAADNDISFFHSALYLDKFLMSKAGFCFMEEKFASKAPINMTAIINSNPYFAYSTFLLNFYSEKKFNTNSIQISSKAEVEKSAIIGEGTEIKSGAYVGNDVKIGKNCFIGANAIVGNSVQIGDDTIINALASVSFCKIGNNVIIHSGVKIGQDGFGFAHNNGRLQKILQLGIVEIHDDVEIGANSCIDRGTISNTVIGKQVKIDNMVQIGHNVMVGEGTVIAGCAGIAGSTKIGRFVQIGGGCNINGHIEIGDGAKIAGGSGVVKSVEPMKSVGGFPALPIKNWHRINIKLLQMLKNKN